MSVKMALNKAKGKLHIAKADLAMSRESYEELIIRHGAPVTKPSSKFMSLRQINNALKEMQQKGWKPKYKGKGGKLSPTTRNKTDHGLVDVIRAVWIDMGKLGVINNASDDSLLSWVRKQTAANGNRIDAIEWLDNQPRVARGLLHKLKAWRKRAATVQL